jgi:hypothetical protein
MKSGLCKTVARCKWQDPSEEKEYRIQEPDEKTVESSKLKIERPDPICFIFDLHLES